MEFYLPDLVLSPKRAPVLDAPLKFKFHGQHKYDNHLPGFIEAGFVGSKTKYFYFPDNNTMNVGHAAGVQFMCSKCGYQVTTPLLDRYSNVAVFKFCPNCGAVVTHIAIKGSQSAKA